MRGDGILWEVVDCFLIPREGQLERLHGLVGIPCFLLGGAEFVVSLANLVGAVGDEIGFFGVLVNHAFIRNRCIAPL